MNQLNDQQLLKTSSFINGQWHQSLSTFDVINPANNQRVAMVSNAGIEETELAVSAAKTALALWSKTSVNERAILLRRWFDLIIENKDDLGRILTLE